MGISFADIREADRLDRSYAAAKRRRNGGGSPAFDAFLFAAKWGLPLLPLLPLVWGGQVLDGAWFSAGLIVVWQIGMYVATGVAGRTEFEVLRFPEPGALFLARLTRCAAWFTVCGAAVAAWRWAMFNGEPDGAAIGTIFVASICGSVFVLATFVRRSGARGAESPVGVASGCVIPGLLLLVLFAALQLAVGAKIPGALVVVLCFALGRRTWLPWWETVLDGVVIALCFSAIRMDPSGREILQASLAVTAAVLALIRATQIVRDGVRRSRFVATDEKDVPSAETDAVPALSAIVRRPRPGVGITGALARKWMIGVRQTCTPLTTVRGPRRAAAFTLLALVVAPLGLAWHLRSAILAAFAVRVGADEAVPAAVLAVAAATFSPSILATDLDARLYLFGVDYREQVRHAMRSWFVAGCLPCVVAAAATLVVTDAAPGAVAAACFLGACLLLRFGWNGFRGESAFASGCLTAIALGSALIVFEPPADLLLPLAAGIAVLGAVGTILRFRNLNETTLRAQMRLKH